MTHPEFITEIQRLTTLIAMKRVRRFACAQTRYNGNETPEVLDNQITLLWNQQRKVLEDMCATLKTKSSS